MSEPLPPVVGLIPAAGRAARLGDLPCSKEIFPVGFQTADGLRRPRPACQHLLEAFRAAGLRRAFVLLRKGKWDIPELLGRGLLVEREDALHLAYLALDATASVPETLDRAYPFIAGERVALGFPDILFEPGDAYRHLVERHAVGGAEVVLGLFPTALCGKTDMVELDGSRVRRLVIKQENQGLEYTWSIAVWGPEFSSFLHDAVARRLGKTAGELFVGDVLQQAIDEGMTVVGVPFPQGSYLDVGTPEDLERAVVRGCR